MYYRWIEVPRCGEVVVDDLRIVTTGCVPTIHTRKGTHYPNNWLRIEDDNPETDTWLFEEGPVQALSIKTMYRTEWNKTQWIKVHPR